MSSKFKVLSIALVALLAFGFYSATTKADVTGSFALNIFFGPLDCESVAVFNDDGVVVPLADQPCERTVFKFDFETAVQINITISGLTIGLHSHIGTTGLEDVILSFATTLGVLDISDIFVFAQPFGRITDGSGMTNFACFENAPDSGVCDVFFVKKRVEISTQLGGVTITNLAVLEDVNFPDCILVHPRTGGVVCTPKPDGGVYTTQSQSFGFGDLIEISGSTPSGINVTGRTGVCISDEFNLIKKHFWPGVVNPDCVAGAQTPSPKIPLFFDFEEITVEGIPLTSDILLDAVIFCSQPTFACNFAVDVTFTGSTIFNPIVASFDFDTVDGPINFDGLRLTLAAGSATIVININSTLVVTSVVGTVTATLNPDTNPASLTLRVVLVPGSGLSSLSLTLSVTRSGLTFRGSAVFGGNPVVLQTTSFAVTAQAGVVTLRVSAVYSLVSRTLTGNISASLTF